MSLGKLSPLLYVQVSRLQNKKTVSSSVGSLKTKVRMV